MWRFFGTAPQLYFLDRWFAEARAAMAERETAALARRLVRGADGAALATRMAADGAPYASLVLLAVDHDLSPLLLLSDLAEHSRNIAADGRVSLLFDATHGLASRLAGARASVMGRAERSAAPRHRARFLARHPDAEVYADFADFAFYRVAVSRCHLVAGFGRIAWLEAADLLRPEALALPLVAAEAEILRHMNAEHADAVALYANALAGQGGDGWAMTGCDSAGFDLRAGGAVCRIDFAGPVADAAGARAELVRLAAAARKIAAGEGNPA
jgi:hypothetical protein